MNSKFDSKNILEGGSEKNYLQTAVSGYARIVWKVVFFYVNKPKLRAVTTYKEFAHRIRNNQYRRIITINQYEKVY